MGKGGVVNIVEPVGLEFVIGLARGYLHIVGWMNFIETFLGHNYVVARVFAESFDGKHVKIGILSIDILKKFISRATNFPLTREHWFKN
jgi:hypothetical protein